VLLFLIQKLNLILDAHNLCFLLGDGGSQGCVCDFDFHDQIFRQSEGLAMGSPSPSILSEVYLQYVECTAIYDILVRSQILEYFRYVDDVSRTTS
jgi:hypothetical protein